jgi:hypothetical protein
VDVGEGAKVHRARLPVQDGGNVLVAGSAQVVVGRGDAELGELSGRGGQVAGANVAVCCG